MLQESGQITIEDIAAEFNLTAPYSFSIFMEYIQVYLRVVRYHFLISMGSALRKKHLSLYLRMERLVHQSTVYASRTQERFMCVIMDTL